MRVAELAVREVLARHAGVSVRLEHWDDLAAEWLDAEHPDARPAGDTFIDEWDREAHESRQEQDRNSSASSGLAAWQVRVDLGSRHEAATLADRVRSIGWPVILHSKRLVIGANCEDDARRLALEIRGTLNSDAAISVQQSIQGWLDPLASMVFPPIGPV
jgi:hypothetical protein